MQLFNFVIEIRRLLYGYFHFDKIEVRFWIICRESGLNIHEMPMENGHVRRIMLSF